MNAIVTRKNADGTYDEVGMRNRTALTAIGVDAIRRKARPFAPCRVEVFACNSFAAPLSTIYL